MTNLLAFLAKPILFALDFRTSCRGECRQGRAGCPSPKLCSWLSDTELAREIESVKLTAPVVPGSIAEVIALEHAAAESAQITGLSLEDCQQYLRRGMDSGQDRVNCLRGGAA